MMKVEPEKDDIYFVVVLRHLGLDREIATLKVKRDYMMAFTPYSLDGSLGLDHHVSLKPSGERHVVSKFRVGDEMIDVPKLKEESIVRFEPPENLTCPVQIYVTGDPLGQFRGLRPAGSSKGEQILLDAENAGFRDGMFVIRIYAVPPRDEASVPLAPDAGARILRFVKSTRPWIAIDVYQPLIVSSVSA